jgi:CRP/FNR family transcriptional regulator, cyclic AMP receptor protein
MRAMCSITRAPILIRRSRIVANSAPASGLVRGMAKEGRPEPIVAKISQGTLAEMIGTTRARVSFFMNKFRKLGLIDYDGHLEIHSSLLNVVLHDEPHING